MLPYLEKQRGEKHVSEKDRSTIDWHKSAHCGRGPAGCLWRDSRMRRQFRSFLFEHYDHDD
jgi:hypothetical protein